MHIRRPSRPRQGPGSPPANQGKALPAQDDARRSVPRAPHERDESADQPSGGGEASARRMAQQGKSDLERGLVDTDKGPAMHEAYDKVREGTPAPAKQRRP